MCCVQTFEKVDLIENIFDLYIYEYLLNLIIHNFWYIKDCFKLFKNVILFTEILFIFTIDMVKKTTIEQIFM